MKLLYYIRRFWEIPMLEKRFFLYGFLHSAMYFIMVKVFPLKFYYKLIVSAPNCYADSNVRRNHINLLINCLGRINRFSFWECNCLNQVLTLRMLCNLSGLNSNVCIMLRKSDIQIVAHATLIIENSYYFLDLKKDARENSIIALSL